MLDNLAILLGCILAYAWLCWFEKWLDERRADDDQAKALQAALATDDEAEA